MKSSTIGSNQLSQVMQEQEAFPITDNLIFATVSNIFKAKMQMQIKYMVL